MQKGRCRLESSRKNARKKTLERVTAAFSVVRPSKAGQNLAPGLGRPGYEAEHPPVMRHSRVEFPLLVSDKIRTGGSTSVGVAPPLASLFYPDQSVDGMNPAYSADLVFALKQPLLCNAGIGVNTAPSRSQRFGRISRTGTSRMRCSGKSGALKKPIGRCRRPRRHGNPSTPLCRCWMKPCESRNCGCKPNS